MDRKEHEWEKGNQDFLQTAPSPGTWCGGLPAFLTPVLLRPVFSRGGGVALARSSDRMFPYSSSSLAARALPRRETPVPRHEKCEKCGLIGIFFGSSCNRVGSGSEPRHFCRGRRSAANVWPSSPHLPQPQDCGCTEHPCGDCPGCANRIQPEKKPLLKPIGDSRGNSACMFRTRAPPKASDILTSGEMG
jgi:hypothetical protein